MKTERSTLLFDTDNVPHTWVTGISVNKREGLMFVLKIGRLCRLNLKILAN